MTTRDELIRGIVECEETAKAYQRRADVYRQALQELAVGEYTEHATVVQWTVRGLATVTLPVSHDRAIVADPTAFAGYVRRAHPTEAERLTVVRKSFASVLLGRVEAVPRRKGRVDVVDPVTGKAVRGVDWQAGGDPLPIRVTTATSARLVFAALAENRLGAHPLPEVSARPAQVSDEA